MSKRIFQAICWVALGVVAAAALLFMSVLYDYFSGVQRGQLRTETELAAQGVAAVGLAYLADLEETADCRITLIDAAGQVLYDNKSTTANMENHLEREEIQQAAAAGWGESARYSATLLERSLYCAKRLPDDTILRLSVAQSTPLSLFLGMLQPLVVIFLAAIILAMALAARLAKKIVRPLNELNLDEPLQNDCYDELAPLLRRIDSQQRQIARQREELRQKQREFATVTANMHEGIVLLNNRGEILSVNPAAARLLQADKEAVGRNIQSYNRSLELSDLLAKALGGEYAETVLPLPAGEYQLNASPVASPVATAGKVSGVALLLLDVSAKSQAEQQRREFTANVSHELKTPLHTISGSAELLAKGLVQPEDMPAFHRRIYAEAQRLINLVEDIIQLSHLDEGAGGLQFAEVDLYALAEDALQGLQPQAAAAGVKLNLQGGSAMLWGVPRLLEEIICNLGDNAIKYNRPQGEVWVKVAEAPDEVVLTVADTGIGIPPEYQERIFERFFRVDKSRSKEVGGTGLGLSIVKHAAQLHKAAVEVASSGEGTVIILRFPKKR